MKFCLNMRSPLFTATPSTFMLNRIGLSLDSFSFLADKQDIINQFVADFDFREQEILLSSHFTAQKGGFYSSKNKK